MPRAASADNRTRNRVIIAIVVVAILGGLFAFSQVFGPKTCEDYLGFSYSEKEDAALEIVNRDALYDLDPSTTYGQLELEGWVEELDDYCQYHKGDELDDLTASTYGF